MTPGVPVNLIDRVYLSDSDEPWVVHAEVRIPVRLSPAVVRAAARSVTDCHPLLSARLSRDGAEWQFGHGVTGPTEVQCRRSDVAVVRDRAVSKAFDLRSEAPVRFEVVFTAESTTLLLTAHHGAVDGIAARAILASWARACDGQEPKPDNTWLAAHSLATISASQVAVDRTVSELRTLSRSLHPGDALWHRDESADASLQVEYRDISSDDPLPVSGRRQSHDRVAASLVFALLQTARRSGQRGGLLIGVPVNLRSARSWSEGVCNASLPWPIWCAGQSPEDVLLEVKSQMSGIRGGRWSLRVRALVAYLVRRQEPPLWMLHALASMATVTSSVPGCQVVWGADETPLPLWGGAPVPRRMGATFSILFDDLGGVRLSTRYRPALIDGTGVTDLLDEAQTALVQMAW